MPNVRLPAKSVWNFSANGKLKKNSNRLGKLDWIDINSLKVTIQHFHHIHPIGILFTITASTSGIHTEPIMLAIPPSAWSRPLSCALSGAARLREGDRTLAATLPRLADCRALPACQSWAPATALPSSRAASSAGRCASLLAGFEQREGPLEDEAFTPRSLAKRLGRHP